MGLSAKELLEYVSEPGFWEAVLGERAGWKARAVHVMEAIYKNAIDREHKDQWLWMQRFERMVGIEFLPHEASKELDLG